MFVPVNTNEAKAKAKIMTTNQGYWDGVADRGRGTLASWYSGCRKNYGHFSADYAEGYSLGIWGKDAPPYALTGKE